MPKCPPFRLFEQIKHVYLLSLFLVCISSVRSLKVGVYIVHALKLTSYQVTLGVRGC